MNVSDRQQQPEPPSGSARVSFALMCREPFRVFFPAAVLAGMAGAAIWPLHFIGWLPAYPGQSHARLMAYGFFGGFIVGFLGTALPRMLSAPPLRCSETMPLLLVYMLMAAFLLNGNVVLGDSAFVLLLVLFSGVVGLRVARRRDVPPPSFILVALGLVCAAVGAAMSIWVNFTEDAFRTAALQHLLVYQGFMLFPLMGVGAFLLPRFFGRATRQDFPESRTPPPGWTKKFLEGLSAGLIIVISFVAESAGWVRLGPALRLAAAAWYLAREVPVFGAGQTAGPSARILQLALVLLLLGFLAIIFAPAYRIGLLHVTLIGGFAVTTLVVGMRVVYGHSGHASLLARPNRWLWFTVAIILLAMATRISGDFWPKVLASHYSYGAIGWTIGLLVWTGCVLPKVLRPDPDDD